MAEKIVLIDGHSILNRAFYGVPDLTNAEGLHTNAVYGFLNIMFRILDEEQPQYLAVAFDLHAPTFRHKMYEAYKGTRHAMPEELREQVPVIKEVLQAMQIPTISMEGYEADDILGTIAGRCERDGLDVTVVSGDRDLLQLATDKIKIRIPKTRGGKTVIEDYYTKDVIEAYQVTPKQIIELKALMGDSSDNIPGLPGVGEKTATKLVVAYGSIENAYEHREEIKPNKAKLAFEEHYDLAELSKILATINTDSPVKFTLEEAKVEDFYTPEAYDWCKRLEFRNLLGRFSEENRHVDITETFTEVTDFGEVQSLMEKAVTAERVGAALCLEEGMEGLAVCLPAGETFYVPAEGFITRAWLMDALRELAAKSPCLCVMDIKALLHSVGLAERKEMQDISLAAYLLNPLKSEYLYDAVAAEYLSVTLPGKEDLFADKKKASEEKLMVAYRTQTCCQAYTAAMAYAPMMAALQAQGMAHLYTDLELPLLYTLYHMEKAGILVERQELIDYGKQLKGRISELEQSIYEKAGESFNINSPKQLGVILFEKLQLPGGKKTKTGYSTAADVLEKLAPEAPIVSDILEYRQLTKLKSTYADGLVTCIADDGRIHSTFNQTITATGRISSTEPNLQNIPVRTELGRLLRKVFVPADGFVFMDADYSQIELRVLAHFSGDQALIEAYRAESDIHRITASQVFHVPFDEVTDLQRRNAKAVNFGIVYGISSFGLSQGLSITRKEAEGYIKRYFETYPGIKAFLDNAVSEAKEKGYVTTLFGRRRPVPELKSSNFMQRSFGERVAMNSPIQGTAADIIKVAMLGVDRRLREESLRSRLILQVHDELLIETAVEEEKQVRKILTEEMMQAADLAVELEIDLHTGNSWYEAK